MPIPLTRTMQLQMALDEARQKAQFLRNRTVRASANVTGTLEQILEQLRQPLWITPSEASLRQWCQAKAADAEARWKASGDNLLAEKSPWYNGTMVVYSVAWKNGVITSGSAKIELLRGKTVSVSSLSELTQGAAYGT
jgi:hypothetical protein